MLKLQSITVPPQLQRNAADVLTDGVEEQENPYSTRWPDGWAARTWLVLTCWT